MIMCTNSLTLLTIELTQGIKQTISKKLKKANLVHLKKAQTSLFRLFKICFLLWSQMLKMIGKNFYSHSYYSRKNIQGKKSTKWLKVIVVLRVSAKVGKRKFRQTHRYKKLSST